MATRWSNDFVVAEHKDLQANAMAVDHSGNLALLYGRRYMAIVNLNEPTETIKKVNRKTKLDVGFTATADWNPDYSRGLFALSSDERVEIFRLQDGDLTLEHCFKAHTLSVTDLQWHKTNPNLLATCSNDPYLNIWDLRLDLRRPVSYFHSLVASNNLRWNPNAENCLASTHDGEVKIWDREKRDQPVYMVVAHLNKIHCLDWNPNSSNQLATSSQDCTVKFFDVNSHKKIDNVLTFTSPVWRVKHTPFGKGLLTVPVSQIRRGEISPLLWNIENQASPVHTFVGHTDVVQEVAWRKISKTDFQLVTWCRDQKLRIWKIEPLQQLICGHNPKETKELDGNGDSKESTFNKKNEDQMMDLQKIKIVSEEMGNAPTIPIQTPETLQQEFSLTNFYNLTVHEMDAEARKCTVSVQMYMRVAMLRLDFPPSYPSQQPPSFEILKESSIDDTMKEKILNNLRQTAHMRAKKGLTSLEPCLRSLASTFESLVCAAINDENDTANKSTEQIAMYNVYTPFPRFSGASFCSSGLLVCFSRPSHLARRVSVRSESNTTPRAYSAINRVPAPYASMTPLYTSSGSTTGSQGPESQALPSFFYADRHRAWSKGRNSGSGPSGQRGSLAKPAIKVPVVIYDAANLLFVHRELAEKYKLKGKDVAEVCHYNAGVALSVGRKDLAQVWQLAALAAATPPPPLPLASHWSENEEDSPSAWAAHPFGQTMIEALVQHYANQYDVQTAAMLSCLFGSRAENLPGHRKKLTNVNVSRLASGKWCLKPGGSPYHTVHPADTSLEGWNFHMLKQNRSNSWSDSLDEIKTLASMTETTDPARMEEIELSTSKMLDEKNSELHDCFKRVYAEILYGWDLLEARMQVLKYVNPNSEVHHRGVEFLADCLHCSKPAQGPSCIFCKRLALQCAICHISVRGSANFCIICGHGGHTKHMMCWFAKEEQCPTGCGCFCLEATENQFDQSN